MFKFLSGLWDSLFEKAEPEPGPGPGPEPVVGREKNSNISAAALSYRFPSVPEPPPLLELDDPWLIRMRIFCVDARGCSSDPTRSCRDVLREEHDVCLILPPAGEAVRLVTRLQSFVSTARFPVEPFTTILPLRSGRDHLLLQIQAIDLSPALEAENVSRVRGMWADSPALVVVFLPPPPSPSSKTRAVFQRCLRELWICGFKEIQPRSCDLPEGEPAIFVRGLYGVQASTNILSSLSSSSSSSSSSDPNTTPPVYVTTLRASS